MDREEKRVEILKQYGILDTEPEKIFNQLAKLATHICGTEAAQINFIDKNRQWTKANIGWGKTELPREMSFCSHTIQSDRPMMIISDAKEDERFKNNPLVNEKPSLRFYAGVTISNIDRYPLGTLCVFDSEPKQLTEQQQEDLQILAEQAEAHLENRIGREKLIDILIQENSLNEKIIENLPLNFFMYNSQGEIVRWNEYMASITGYSDEEIQQKTPESYFRKADRELIRDKMEQVFEGNQVRFEADFHKKDGSMSPFLFSAARFQTEEETYLIGTGQDISDIRETQQKLQQSIKDKEVLLAEVHHRVKNNLAVISGLIELETFTIEDSTLEQKLLNTMLRIRSMAVIHEIMYQSVNFTHVAYDDVVDTIKENIRSTYNQASKITFESEIQQITLNVNQAIPCGLIINELLTNAYKHAYTNRQEGVIRIEMHENNGTITVTVADEGVGLPKEEGPGLSSTLGFTLVHQLSKQLNADLQIDRQDGTKFRLTFEKKDVKGAGSAHQISTGNR